MPRLRSVPRCYGESDDGSGRRYVASIEKAPRRVDGEMDDGSGSAIAARLRKRPGGATDEMDDGSGSAIAVPIEGVPGSRRSDGRWKRERYGGPDQEASREATRDGRWKRERFSGRSRSVPGVATERRGTMEAGAALAARSRKRLRVDGEMDDGSGSALALD